MVLKRFAFIALFTGSLGIVSSMATAQDSASPANPPPDDFAENEFVDINGCVFIRGGVNGRTTWVPRVTRSREQVCGQTPTFAAADDSGAEAPAPQIDAPAPTETVVAPIVVPGDATPEDVAAIRQAAATSDEDESFGAKGAAGLPPQPRAVPRLVRAVPEMKGTFMRDTGDQIVMMEPATHVEASHPIHVVNPPKQSKPGQFRPSGRLQIVPLHVWEQQDHSVMHVPAGYRPAWDDGRLNPFRAWQTVQGFYDTQEVWTNTVPRRLVKIEGSQRIKNPVLVGDVEPRMRPVQHVRHVETMGAFLSSKGEPAQREVRGKPRFVEIGVFTTDAKARAAAARLAAQGLSARIGTVRHNGQNMRRVQAGPYSDGAPIQAAMSKVRAAGYVQAYLR